MNIWQLDPANLTPYYDKALCTALADSGQNVRFITTKYIYDEALTYPDTFSVVYHYFQYLNQPFLVDFSLLRRGLRVLSYPLDHWRFLQQCREQKPDVLHIQWSRVPVLDIWLIRQVQKLEIPVVHTVHDVVPLFSQGRFSGNLGDVLAQANALIVHTKDSHNKLLQEYPQIEVQRVHVIPHLQLPQVQPVQATRKLARTELGMDDNAPVALFMGTLRHYKGIDLLLEIYRITRDTYPDVQLWVVGKSETDNDRKILAELKQEKNVFVYDEYVPDNDVWRYFLAADIVLFPYRTIFQSGALMTTLGFGCPVIVTDVGGLPDGVDGNGWVVPPENPQLFAEALIDALSDRERLQAMGQRSRQIVADRFGAEAIVEQHLHLYRSLL